MRVQGTAHRSSSPGVSRGSYCTKCVDKEPRNGELVARLFAVALERVPLGSEGGEVVAVGFARLLVGDIGVERVAGVGDLQGAVFAFGRPQFRGRGAVARL